MTVDPVTGALVPAAIHDHQQRQWQHHRPRPGAPAGDGADTLWNVENLRFCLARDVNNKCNAFYDVPINPIAPAVAPAIDLSAYSLTFAPADIGTPSAGSSRSR